MKEMSFGVSTVDITPPVGVTLVGYNPRISERIAMPLRAEALACTDAAGGGWILISADVLGFGASLSGGLRRELAAATGLPPTAINLAPTHTHSGPRVIEATWCENSELESRYYAELRRKLVALALQAWQQRTPGELLVGRTSAPAIGRNRRQQQPDGSWTNLWSDPKNKGYFDATVELVGLRRPDGRIESLLVNFGCHPVGFGPDYNAISGDYVGYLKQSLEAGGQVGTVIFTMGGHANINPRTCVQNDETVVQAIGEKLAQIVAAALPQLEPLAAETAGALSEPWHFETTWNLEGRPAVSFPHGSRGKAVEASIAVWGAGDLAFIGLPGETVSEYRDIFGSQSPFKHTILVSLTNDYLGYFATDAILREGAYEARMCPLNPIQEVLTHKGRSALAALDRQLRRNR